MLAFSLVFQTIFQIGRVESIAWLSLNLLLFIAGVVEYIRSL